MRSRCSSTSRSARWTCSGSRSAASWALVLAGRDDALVPPSATEALAKLLPRARFEVHPGGHAFLLESAGAVAASVLRFLRSIEGDRGGA